jgi:hypothetical protein
MRIERSMIDRGSRGSLIGANALRDHADQIGGQDGVSRNRPVRLSITHIFRARFAPVESSMILSVTPNRGGVTDEQRYRSRGTGWLDDEIVSAGLPDKRLARRLRRLLDQMSAAPGQLVPAACGDWAATKAAYRFFGNPRVTEHGVLVGHVRRQNIWR